MNQIKQVYVVDALRTPVGRFGGTLAAVRPDDLAALVLGEILKRNPNVQKEDIEEVILGAANQAGEDNRNVARMALLMAGLNKETAGVTVNRLCASGLQSIADAAKNIMLGMGDVYLAGGVESMSRAPFVMAKSPSAWNRTAEIYDTSIGWRFTNPKLAEAYHPYGMGETAENLADKYKITREEQDEFSHQTQVKYVHAHERNAFAEEIVPVHIPQRKGDDIVFEKDEHPRLSSLEKLASLKPAFRNGGSVTAGNSSGINDGSAALILASEVLRDET
jgi:acetyl-CoA acetyltransferase family protein